MKDKKMTDVKEKVPYMSKGIYNNYEKGMKASNQKRRGQGLTAIPIRTFEEWSGKQPKSLVSIETAFCPFP